MGAWTVPLEPMAKQLSWMSAISHEAWKGEGERDVIEKLTQGKVDLEVLLY